MPPFSVPVVHAADRYVVIDKPSGLLSVPGKVTQDCAAWRVRLMFPGATGPMVVHRLDMETSGLMVLGLDEGAQRELSMQFESRFVEKQYVAELEGEPPGESGEVRLPLRPDINNRPVQIVDFTHGMRAHTSWKLLDRRENSSRVLFSPVTGRTHQLRVHAATPKDAFGEKGGGMGCPILGDGLYGTRASAPRLMLHASRLAFNEPGTGARVEFEAPIPF